MDSQIGLDRCKFADYKGKIIYQSEYVTCTEKPPVPDERLLLKQSNSSFIYLRDGTLLVEVSLCNGRNAAPNAAGEQIK
jgi:hypothetical protein